MFKGLEWAPLFSCPFPLLTMIWADQVPQKWNPAWGWMSCNNSAWWLFIPGFIVHPSTSVAYCLDHRSIMPCVSFWRTLWWKEYKVASWRWLCQYCQEYLAQHSGSVKSCWMLYGGRTVAEFWIRIYGIDLPVQHQAINKRQSKLCKMVRSGIKANLETNRVTKPQANSFLLLISSRTCFHFTLLNHLGHKFTGCDTWHLWTLFMWKNLIQQDSGRFVLHSNWPAGCKESVNLLGNHVHGCLWLITYCIGCSHTRKSKILWLIIEVFIENKIDFVQWVL